MLYIVFVEIFCHFVLVHATFFSTVGLKV